VVLVAAELYPDPMQGLRVVALSLALPLLGSACRMENPAFGDDELADSGESASETSESTSTDASGTESATSDATTETPTTTSDSTTSDTTANDTNLDTSESDTLATSDTGVPCPDPLFDCDGTCVSLEDDPDNCGECGNACGEGHVCIGTCTPIKYVFASSEVRTGVMGGIGGADMLCNQLAAAATLPGSYYAWNSTDGSYPNFDFVKEGAYVRTDGVLVATSYADLTDGSLLAPINLDEIKEPASHVMVPGCPNVTGGVWSNTTPAGNYAGNPNCGGWSLSLQVLGRLGNLDATDTSWTDAACQAACIATLPIYCVQQTG